VKLLVPDPVGVPEIAPVLDVSASPVGKVPEMIDQVYGVAPPVAARVALYVTFCVPLGNEVVVMEGCVIEGAALTVKLSAFVAASELASVTCIVKLLTPLPVGLPEIAPVLGVSASPVGKAPETIDQVYGVAPPVAASVALYAEFCVPLANEVVVIEGGFGVFTLFTVKVAEKLVVFPKVSLAVTISVCGPFASLVVSQLNVYGLVVVLAKRVPSLIKSTADMLALSITEADTVTFVPDTVLPRSGLVKRAVKVGGSGLTYPIPLREVAAQIGVLS
jgi:hypothetical protein